MVNAKPRPLESQEKPDTHCIGGWVGLEAGLDLCGKFPPTPHRDSIPGRPACSESLYRLRYLEKLTCENMETEIPTEAASFCSYSRPSPAAVVTHIASEQQLSAFTHTHTHTHIYIYIYIYTHTYTRVGTLIVATIYLQLIQSRYMFRSFTVLQCSHQHCVQPVTSDVEVVGYI